MKKIRLLLIEDNRLLRDGILGILKPHKDILIIAASGNGKNTLVKIKQLKPNVVLLDLGLTKSKQFTCSRNCEERFP